MNGKQEIRFQFGFVYPRFDWCLESSGNPSASWMGVVFLSQIVPTKGKNQLENGNFNLASCTENEIKNVSLFCLIPILFWIYWKSTRKFMKYRPEILIFLSPFLGAKIFISFHFNNDHNIQWIMNNIKKHELTKSMIKRLMTKNYQQIRTHIFMICRTNFYII